MDQLYTKPIPDLLDLSEISGCRIWKASISHVVNLISLLQGPERYPPVGVGTWLSNNVYLMSGGSEY